MERVPAILLNTASFRALGNRLLIAGLAGSLALVLALVWFAPAAIWFVPAALIAVVGFAAVWHNPIGRFTALLVGFVALTDYVAGIQVGEVAYGLFFLLYLGHWAYTALFIDHRSLVRSGADAGVLGLLLLVVAYVPLALVFGGNMPAITGELSAFVLFAIYFPVKDALTRYRVAPWIVLGSVLFIGIFVSIRNFFEYKDLLLHATHAWQVAKGRVVTNDNILMVVCLFALTIFSFTKPILYRAGLLGVFFMFFAALILTQSRGYWVAFLLGAGILFLLLGWTQKRRLLVLGFWGAAIGTVLALLFFSEEVAVVVAGLLDRFLSLKTAATADISLVNRFRETAAVWQKIRVNPILGYGMGVPYPFFDLAHMATEHDAFVHNGYIGLWYKYGLLGLGLILGVWILSIRRGIQAYRASLASMATRLCGLASAVTLSAFMLTTITSNPFYLNDTLFIFGFLLGVAQGAYERTRLGTE
ncbi:MAG: O-antigen ligase family protein [Rhodothermales bacterium]